MTITIDLNADLGELPGEAGRSSDRAILEHVTSCAIACGGHVGDPETMKATLLAAAECHVAAGAHPSYPDRDGFGRRSIELAAGELEVSLVSQMVALRDLADAIDIPIMHVKPHGALYNDASKNRSIAETVISATGKVFGRSTAIVCQPGFALAEVSTEAGFSVYGEAFIDRAYCADGTLVPRGDTGAVIEAIDARLQQARDIAEKKGVRLPSGDTLALEAATLCIHGDSPDAAETARAVKLSLESDGVKVRAPTRS
ncbi:MAG: 5-oxoprolinase subunit PxpA [Pseudomonadota bacterium]